MPTVAIPVRARFIIDFPLDNVREGPATPMSATIELLFSGRSHPISATLLSGIAASGQGPMARGVKWKNPPGSAASSLQMPPWCPRASPRNRALGRDKHDGVREPARPILRAYLERLEKGQAQLQMVVMETAAPTTSKVNL
jgi:hypothetical protein